MLEKRRAQFTPAVTSDLTPEAQRCVGLVSTWQNIGTVEDGPYEGDEMWFCISYAELPGGEPPGWAPRSDLTFV